MLQATHLGKRFGHRWLFRRIELSLDSGDCLAVTGQNGSGKSTFLKCLVGLVTPSEGQVQRPEILGYSALDLSVYPALTAGEHLELGGDLRGCPARIDELLTFVGLESAIDQQAGEFSTGMRNRLKLALAIQPEPSLLVLDEPAAGLDEQGKVVLTKVVEQQLQRGACVLATNDDFELAHATHRLEIGS